MSAPVPGASGEVCPPSPEPTDPVPPRTSLAELGGWVRRRRLAAGMSQHELGRAAGVPQSILSRVEHGRTVASHQVDRVVTAVLGGLRAQDRPNRTVVAMQELRHAVEADLHELLEDLVPEWDEQGRRLPVHERVRLLVAEYREMEAFLNEDLLDEDAAPAAPVAP